MLLFHCILPQGSDNTASYTIREIKQTLTHLSDKTRRRDYDEARVSHRQYFTFDDSADEEVPRPKAGAAHHGLTCSVSAQG